MDEITHVAYKDSSDRIMEFFNSEEASAFFSITPAFLDYVSETVHTINSKKIGKWYVFNANLSHKYIKNKIQDLP